MKGMMRFSYFERCDFENVTYHRSCLDDVPIFLIRILKSSTYSNGRSDTQNQWRRAQVVRAQGIQQPHALTALMYGLLRACSVSREWTQEQFLRGAGLDANFFTK
jgi:hypothetical protein